MYLYDTIRRSLRSLLSAKSRTILTAFAIAVGTFALTLTLGASNGASNYANIIIKDNFDPTELIVSNDNTLFKSPDKIKPQVYDQSFSSVVSQAGAAKQVKVLSDNDMERIRQIPGVESVRPAISLNLQYITRDGQKKYVGTMQEFSSYKEPDLLAGTIPKNIPNHSLIIPEGFLEPLGFTNAQNAINKVVRVAVQKQVNQTAIISSILKGDVSSLKPNADNSNNSIEEQFKVIAVTKKPSTLVQPGTELYLYGNNSDVVRLNDYTTQNSLDYHKYLLAYVKVINGTNITTLNDAQAKIKKAGYSAQSVIDTEKTLTQVITVLQGIVMVFGLIAVVASVFGVVNTMYISVLQRTREIGLMKALGMHKRDINKLFLFEAALIGLFGGLLGSLTAVTLGTLLNPWISKKLSLGNISLLDFRLDQIIGLILMLVIIAVVAGLLPARKASKLEPIEALRIE